MRVTSLSALLTALGLTPLAVAAAPGGGITITAAPTGSGVGGTAVTADGSATPGAAASGDTASGGPTRSGGAVPAAGATDGGFTGTGSSSAESSSGESSSAQSPDGPAATGSAFGPYSSAQEGPDAAEAADDAAGRDLSFTGSAFRGAGLSVSVTTDGDLTVAPGWGYALSTSMGEVPANPTESSIGLQGQLSALGFNSSGSVRASRSGLTMRITATRDLPGGLEVGYGWDFTLDGNGLSIVPTADNERGTALYAKGWTRDLGWVDRDSFFTGYIAPAFTFAREDRDAILGAIFGREGPPVEESEFMDRDAAWAERLKPYEGPVFDNPALPPDDDPYSDDPYSDPLGDEPDADEPYSMDPTADPLADGPDAGDSVDAGYGDVDGFDAGDVTGPGGWAEGDPGFTADDAGYGDDGDTGFGDGDGYGGAEAGEVESDGSDGYGGSESDGSDGYGGSESDGSDGYGGSSYGGSDSGGSSSSSGDSGGSTGSGSTASGGFSTSSTGDGGF
ncbi:hypothetical protein GCM10009557_33440 [Virgisporangium ochraceum]